VATQTFRIEAEGKIGGRVGARIRAVVQRQQGGTGAAVAFLEWSGVE
jgi:hypothetical protein